MAGVNDIPAGLRTPTQIPLDAKGYFASQAVAANLGAGNNLAFTYEKGMLAYCALEGSRWEWREEAFSGEPGLVPTSFTYPANHIINGITYSNKVFNFFPDTPLSGFSVQQLVDTLGLELGWKKGDVHETRTLDQMPRLVTDNIYTRNGFIGRTLPTEEDGSVVRNLDNVFIEAHIQNLSVKITRFQDIAAFNPVLVISKYLPSRRKKHDRTPEETVVSRKRAGFKIPTVPDPIRVSRVPLNKGFQVIDFGQEHYFTTPANFGIIENTDAEGQKCFLQTRGAGQKYSNIKFVNTHPVGGNRGNNFNQHKAFIYLQFQLEVTSGTNKFLSKPMGRVKMEAIMHANPEQTYDPGDIIRLEDTPLQQHIAVIRFKQA